MSIVRKEILDQSIMTSLFRYAGNVKKVSDELDVPLDYVIRIERKIKKKFARDVSYFVASGIMQELRLGREQRKAEYQLELERLGDRLISKVSSCCRRPVAEHKLPAARRTGKILYVCTRCRKLCESLEIDNLELAKLRMEILEAMREEDVSLQRFAEKLGFSGTPPVPSTVVRQDIFMFGKDKEVIDDVKKLGPAEAERLIRGLERKIVENEIVEED